MHLSCAVWVGLFAGKPAPTWTAHPQLSAKSLPDTTKHDQPTSKHDFTP